MNVLLIGGTGVLSSDIRDLATKKGYSVYILNRGLNRVKNTNKNVKTIICDIRNSEQAKEVLKDYQFDVVVDFISFELSQIQNTLNLFLGKCKQYIFISSATVYRNIEPGEKITEDFELSNYNWKYASDKIECEKYLVDICRENNQKYTIIRPYVTYSDARIPYAIIPQTRQYTMINRILNDKPIVIWDDGNVECTLTYAGDFAVGIVGLFLNEKAYDEAFHITTDFTITWRDALLELGKALNKDVNIIEIPTDFIVKEIPNLYGVLKGDKALNHVFDNSKIKNAVPEFNANTKFSSGIKNVVDFYQQHPELQGIDYEWDGVIDRLITNYLKQNNKKSDIKKIINGKNSYKKNQTFKNRIMYIFGKNKFLNKVYLFSKNKMTKIYVKLKQKKRKGANI